uniref:Uncharacterized protein n=1 Tax=Amblyomma triste TaxID=251400 RepID=A0A023GB65_AMBTT
MGLTSRVLTKLKAYGDSFLEDSDGAPKTDASKPVSRKSKCHDRDKRRTCSTAPTKLTKIDRMRIELGLEDAYDGRADAQPEPPRQDSVSVVLFQDPSKRKAKKRQVEENGVPNDTRQGSSVIDFKKARYDVLKFGIKGLEKPKQEEAKIALAVQLGAKPPKNKYMNYKELIYERKEQKIKNREERIVNAKMGVKPKRQGNAKHGKPRHARHDGVHIVSKELISKVQRKRQNKDWNSSFHVNK